MYKLIQVRYRNNREGLLDDITLGEMIREKKIRQFYRPSESRWVDVETDPVRSKPNGFNGPERRETIKSANEEKPPGLIARFLRRRRPEKPPSAQEWFEQGFVLLHTTEDYREAIRAFAKSIDLDPGNSRAYLNRGLAYERLNNLEQAMSDYTRALELSPRDAKIHYVRGIARWGQGRAEEALQDIRTAAQLGYLQARNFLKAKRLDR